MALGTAAAITKLRSLTGKFDQGMKQATPFWPAVCSEIQSDGYDEEYGLLGAIPGIREWVGNRDFKDLRAANWTIVNRDYEVSLRIQKNRIEDDRLSIYGPLLQMLGIRMAQHPDELLFDLINGGEAAACFDTQFFFDTDHVWGDSGAQSNDLTYTCAAPATPTVAEMKLAFNAAVRAMSRFVDDQNKLLNPHVFDVNQAITIVCDTHLLQPLEDALSVRLQATGGDNVVIARPNIVASALYNSTLKFDIYKIDEPLKPYIFQKRKPASRQMKGLDDAEFKDVKFMADARYNVGYGAWWTAVRTTLI